MKTSQIGYAVMWTQDMIEKMVAKDNDIFFHPYTIFSTKEEAKSWRNEKYMGHKDDKTDDMIREVICIFV